MATRGDGGGIRITPDDPRYPTLCSGYNPRWTAAPDYIRLPRTSDEVVHALRTVVAEDAPPDRSRITVRSGGHRYENFVCSSVAVGGHVAGGGFGLLSRQYGLTVDYLDAVEVAVVDAQSRVELVRAGRDDTDAALRDLWWAHTGGGGGNFGIVTRYWFRDLPPAPKAVLRATGGWRWPNINERRFRRIVANFGQFFAEHQGPDDRYRELFAILLLSHPSQDTIGVIAQIDAGVPDAPELLAEFQRAIGKGAPKKFRARITTHEPFRPIVAFDDLVAASAKPVDLPWTLAALVTGAPHGDLAGKYKSAYLRAPLPERQVTAAWKALTADRKANLHAVVQLDSYGSAVNRIAPDATAAGQRDSIMKVQYQVYWPPERGGAAELRWIRELYRDMYPGGVPAHSETADGCFVNYPDVDLSDPEWNTSGVPWPALYYGANYTRLQRAKLRWDPLNIFRHAQSVELPAGQ